MKKFIKGMVATFTFMLALVVCGATKVSAEELKESLNNTSITEESAIRFTSAEKTFYVTPDGNVTFKAAKNNNGGSAGLFFNSSVVYWADFAIVKCTALNGTACGKWSVYKYAHEGKNSGAYVMDDLKNGLNINLNEIEFAPETNKTVNYVELGTLKSIYDLTNTYFAVVHYYQGNAKLFAQKERYQSEILPIVLKSSVSEMKVSHTVVGSVATFTVESGTPINTVSYFATATKLEGTYDFAAKLTENAGVTPLAAAVENPKATNGVFKYEFNVTVEEGKHYYLQATDLAGRVVTYDATEMQSVNEEKKTSNDDNVGDTNIGKIILIALLVLLVISIALVIVQKIVDHKRKLY